VGAGIGAKDGTRGGPKVNDFTGAAPGGSDGHLEVSGSERCAAIEADIEAIGTICGIEDATTGLQAKAPSDGLSTLDA
jgi:hypothetical protein